MKNVKSGHTKPIVCLDAGHYGKYNPSPAVKGYYESDMAWKLHLLLKKYLEKYGFEVKVTRSAQANDLDLYKRGFASKGCDLFLSLHSNAVANSVNETVDYAAIYHLTDDTTTNVDDASKAIAEKIAPVIADVMDTKKGYKVLSRKSSSDKNKDGIMNDNYYGVLNGARQAGTAGLILEHSFHTNTRATKWLMDDNNLDKLAKAEAEVLADYYGMSITAGATKPTAPTTQTTTTTKMYRVRKSWADSKSQVGAYKDLDNAKAACDKAGADYHVFDDNCKIVYSVAAPEFKSYKVQITASALNVRAGAGTSFKVNMSVKKGEVYTIVEEKNGWGLLKSGAGWISLEYTKKV